MIIEKRGKVKQGKTLIERRQNNNHEHTDLFPPLTFEMRHARAIMTIMLMLSDLLSLTVAFALAFLLRKWFLGEVLFFNLGEDVAVLSVFLLVYSLSGLYPGVGLSPVHEMRRLFGANNIVFLILIAITFWQQNSEIYSRFVLATAWFLVIFIVQGARWTTRIVGRNLGIWGEPVAVVGTGPQTDQIVQFLKDRIRLGMIPHVVVDGHASYRDSALELINYSNIRTVILVSSEMSSELQKNFINDQRYGYHRRHGETNISRMILISSLGWVGSLGIIPYDLDGALGLEVRQNLLNNWPNFIKRVLDVVLAIFGGILLSPLFLLLMVLIKIDSTGNIFYFQERVGRGGKIFKIWKFRTMVENADEKLSRYLETDPRLKEEWDRTNKLKNDPRITRVGKFMRKFSLDEFPQLINVLKGEMSLVGPRPIFPSQQNIFGDGYTLYLRVRPGMTGLWQVRGRSKLSAIGEERTRLDEYYVRNWSVWMDIYILLRTVQVVLSRDGAY